MIKQAEITDINAAAELAALLYGPPIEKHKEELTALLVSNRARIFLKYENGMPIGFAQCQLRGDYVEGTSSSPVGYLEGIFVRERYRHKGYARELLSACEQWAKEIGCTEFASDCELTNTDSFLFHEAMRFTEANRIICFTKKL